MNKQIISLAELAKKLNYELRNINQPLSENEDFSKTIRPFDFSLTNGGTTNAFKYYNTHYLYPLTNNN